MTKQQYINDLVAANSAWKEFWAIPFADAYEVALRQFNDHTRTDVSDQLSMKLLLLLVSVGAGGGLAAAFGTTVMRTIVATQTLNIVCRNNMTRALNWMAYVERSPAASAVAGQAWDGLSSIVSSEARTLIEGKLASANSTFISTRRMPSARAFQGKLTGYVEACYQVAYAIARGLSDEQYAERQAELNAASFLADKPSLQRPAFTNERRNQELIELLLYMPLIMSSDFYRVHSGWSGGRAPPTAWQSLDRSANADNYPTQGQRLPPRPEHFLFDGMDGRRVEIAYVRPTSTPWQAFDELWPRLNLLHRRYFRGPFQVGSYGRDEIQRAERLSARIQSRLWPDWMEQRSTHRRGARP